MKHFNKLLTKNLTRKEFLIYLGLILLTMSGVSGIFKSFNDLIIDKADEGYGSRSYGV